MDELRAETQRISDEDSESSESESSPGHDARDKTAVDRHAFLFGYRSFDVDLRSLHPLPSQIPFLWQVYQENVDPIVKILHIPTVSTLIRNVRLNLDNLTPATEALIFAIYYAAVSSLDEDEVDYPPPFVPRLGSADG